jgi:hypothetical protein
MGFVRQRGATSLWAMSHGNGTIFYEVWKGSKNPYIPGLGGHFKVDCDFTESSDKKDRSLPTAISHMEYFSDDDLLSAQRIQDRVLRKIISQSPDETFQRLTLEAWRPTLALQVGIPFHRNGVFTVPYLDKADVAEWGHHLAGSLTRLLDGIRTRPRFFMRSDPLSET